MNQGAMKANALAVGELRADFRAEVGTLWAKAAFVNTQTGKTHGWTEHQSWSPRVQQKLEELKALMEEDLSAVHLEGYAPVEGKAAPAVKLGGLGEHINGEDASEA